MPVITRAGTSKLWIRYRDPADGKWRKISTGYDESQRALAEEMERELVARLAASVRKTEASQVTLRAYAERWLAERQDIETAADERLRFANHILPALGDIPIGELRPRQVRDFVEALRKKVKLGNRRKDGSRVATDQTLAPRTQGLIYSTLRAMLNDAVADEVIQANPCMLKKRDLPPKVDRDPGWRRGAVFVRDEIESIISPNDQIPDDRRMLYAIMFLAACRFGEAAAVTWRDYDATCTPLGKLVIERSFSSRKRKVKGTKTGVVREMPVHPTLARILAAWKLGGFERVFGRAPLPDDPIVPSRRGGHRSVNASLQKFHRDLSRLGLRSRRQHDARRSLISIARADGANVATLRWCTHGPSSAIMDSYTTLPWDSLCAEVAKIRLGILEGKLIAMPQRVAVGVDGRGTDHGTDPNLTVIPGTSSGSWLSAGNATSLSGDTPAQSIPRLRLVAVSPSDMECATAVPSPVTASDDPWLSSLDLDDDLDDEG